MAKRAKKAKEPVARPAAIEVFRSAASRYPPKSWWDTVVEVVGDEDDSLQFWRLVVFFYVGQGWNPTNIDNMLRFFREGKVPEHPEMNRNAGQGSKATIDLSDQRDPVMISL